MPDRVIVARSPQQLADGEVGFVTHPEPDGRQRSFQDVLSAEDCAAIDREAYEIGRTWWSQYPPSVITGDVSAFGRAIEYIATTRLIDFLRARIVLERITERESTVELRGLSPEWSGAARSLELRVTVSAEVAARWIEGVSAVHRRTATLASLGFGRPQGTTVGLLGAPEWVLGYHAAVASHRPVTLVDPGRRSLARLAWKRARVGGVQWTAEMRRRVDPPTAFQLDGPYAEVLNGLGQHVDDVLGRYHAGIGFGRDSGVVLASQDSLPMYRAFLLGFRQSGGRVVTLEHGIAGSYAHQIRSVANRLAVWGEQQARYHRARQDPATSVDIIGSAYLSKLWNRGSSRRNPGIDVLYLAQPAPGLSAGNWESDHTRTVAMARELSARRPDLRIAMKLHPAMHAYGSDQVVQGIPVVAGRATDLIRASRSVVVVSSTAGMEAMVLGVPVVQVEPQGPIGDPSFLTLSGAANSVGDLESFIDTIDEVLTDAAIRQAAAARGREFARTFVADIEHSGKAEHRLATLVTAEVQASEEAASGSHSGGTPA